MIGGPFNEGEPDRRPGGDFKVRYANGDIYEGLMKDLKRHGTGRLHQTNEDLYEGGWLEDKRDGMGKMTIK